MSTKTNERPGTKAQVRYLRMSASKARVVLNLIRNKHVAEASQILQFSERLAAKEIHKVLRSAVANAEHNDEIPSEELFVSACFADEGPTLKRFRPRARGRAGRIQKQTCHVTVVVSRLSTEELDRLREKSSASGSASADAAAKRRERVAASRGEEVADEPEVETEDVATDEGDAEATAAAATAEAATEAVDTDGDADDSSDGDAAAEGESEADSETIDSDGDGEANATDESPYGDGSHALIDGDPDQMPEGFPVKGNADSKLYHNEDSPFYGRTKAEVWFASDEAAEAAGFSKPESQQKKEEAAEAQSDEQGDAE